jgi:uncharacterized protein (DUF2141 family)
MDRHIFLSFTLILLLFSRCAQVVNLSGGEVDRTPPALVKATPAMSSVSYTGAMIALEFNEYVQVLDATNEVLVSPRLEELPVITAKGKKVFIDLSGQVLKQNTTYRISFGNAIADMNERNVLRGLEYVFSTGSSIDSLIIKGHVLQAEDNVPAADLLACLYDAATNSDSLPYKTLPLYICKGDKSGNFQFTHLPPATYELMVIADKNRNLLYDGEKERIGFPEKNIRLTQDTSVELKAFKEPPAKTFVVKANSQEYGKALLVLNQSSNWILQPLKKTETRDILLPDLKEKTDSLRIFYRNIKDTLSLVSVSDKGVIDTLYIRLPAARKNKVADPLIRLPQLAPQANDKAILSFNRWMDTSATRLSQIKVLTKIDTTVKQQSVKGRWLSVSDFQINDKLLPGTSYSVVADSAAFLDQQKNETAAFVLAYQTKAATDFGKLTLNIKFKLKQHYVVEVLNERQQVIDKHPIYLSLSASNAVSVEFSMLPPGTYQIRIVYDENQNEKWDSGDLFLRKQPEKISILAKQLKVIADWELEEEIIEK